jgi:hypothetical protein
VELSTDGHFQLLPSDAEILIQIEGKHLLWHKERLLNIALQSVPRDCQLVAWLDCDVVFEEPNWAERTAQLLRKFKIVEPFSSTYDIAQGGLLGESGSKQDEGYSLMYGLTQGTVSPDILRGNMRVEKRISSGLAWAARRDVLDRHGFYDACVMGSGNRAMACAALGRFDDAIDYLKMNPTWARHYMEWAQPFFDTVQGSVGYTDGSLFHLWHGTLENRRYADRHMHFSKFCFDPAKDIFVDDKGAWRWSGANTELEAYMHGYFRSRREDG